MSQISSKYQKDFKNLDYKNPRIARDKEKIKKRLIKIAVWTAGVAIVALVYFLFFSPFFQIKTIEVNGLNKVKKESLDQIINDYRFSRKWFVLSRDNFWIFNSNDLKNAILEKYFFDDLKIRKRMFSRVIIDLKEKESTVNWFTGDQCFHLDPSGIAIEYCEESGGLLKIMDSANAELAIGQSAIQPEELVNIIAIDDRLSPILKGKLTISNYEKTGNSLAAKTLEGPMIYLNSAIPAAEQAGRLAVLINQSDLKAGLNKVNYIDLRFGEKVFYK